MLEALESQAIRIDALAGASAGAIAAALYAAGHKPREIKEMLKDQSFFGFSRIKLSGGGIFNMEGLRKLLEQHLGATRFEDLPIPLFVAATDLADRKTVFFSDGPLVDALLASSCVPFVFEPVNYRGRQWVDGGILNNFPTEPLKDHCDYLIGSHVNRLADDPPGQTTLRKMQVVERCFHMAIAGSVYAKASQCDLFLDPPELARYSLFDIRDAEEIYGIGFRHCLLRTGETAFRIDDPNQ